MNHTIRYLGRLFALLILCTAGALLARAGLYYLGMTITFACGWIGCLSTVAFLEERGPASIAAPVSARQYGPTVKGAEVWYEVEGIEEVRDDA